MSPERSWKMRVERNIIAHEYFGLSLKIIWRTIQNDLTLLSNSLQEMLEKEA